MSWWATVGCFHSTEVEHARLTKEERPRKRRTRVERVQILERFDTGNETPTDFCRTEGIGVASFSQWRRKLKDEPTPTLRFIEINPLPTTANQGWQFELALGDGVVLRLSCT